MEIKMEYKLKSHHIVRNMVLKIKKVIYNHIGDLIGSLE